MGSAGFAADGFLDGFFDDAGVAMAIVDRHTRFLRVNRALAMFFGMPREVAEKRSLAELFPDLGVALAPAFHAVLCGESVRTVDVRISPRNRSDGLWTWTISVIRIGDSVVGASVVVADASDRRRAEERQRQAEARLHALCEVAPLGVFMTNARGESTYTNDRCSKQLGMTREEARGEGWIRAVHPDDLVRTRQRFRAAAAARASYDDIHRYLHPDGRIVWADVKADAVYDGDDLLGYVGLVEDVTERRRVDAALREAEQRFEKLAENLRSVYWLSAADRSTLYYVSPAFADVWGREDTEVESYSDAILASVHPDDRDRMVSVLSTAVDQPFEYSYRIVRPDGTVAHISDRCFPIRDESGAVVRVAGIATNVTRQKELEARLHRTHRLDSIGRLAAGFAHDIHNLLGVVVNQGDMVSRAVEKGRPASDELGEMRDAASRALELTRHLLGFARDQKPDPRPLDLNDTLKHVERFLRRVVGGGIHIVSVFSPNLGIIRADAIQIEQILVNLSVNARDAMPEGGGLSIETANATLTLDSPESDCVPPGRYVVVRVSDTGQGIAKADLERVFEPFFTTKHQLGGTGLGLSAAAAIVEQHGGKMRVESRLGDGTTFHIYFPRIDEPVEHVPVSEKRRSATLTESQKTGGKPITGALT